MVSDLTIKCDFEFNGCQQSVKLGLLSFHLKECPHRLCAKCGFGNITSVEHNCIDLLKNDRNDLKDKYEKQLEVIKELKEKDGNKLNLCIDLKRNYEKQLEIINRQKEEISGLKTKLETNEKLLQNKTNNTIADKEVPNNEYICNSIESIYFGTFKTRVGYFEVYQDSFKFNYVESNRSTPSGKVLINFTLFFNAYEECNVL